MRGCIATILINGFLLGQLGLGQQPTFRTTVDLVRFDVAVRDSKRKPVLGLTQADFVVIEDGKEQPVSAFSEVRVPERELNMAPWVSDATRDVTTNVLGNRRIIVMVMDDAILRTPFHVVQAKEAAHKFIAALGPTDLVSLVFTADNRRPEDFTTDRARLYAAIDRLNIGSGFGGTIPDLFRQYTVGTLYRASELLRDLPEARKAIVYITPGIPYDPAPLIGDRNPAVFELRHEVDRLLESARLSNVTIYSLWVDAGEWNGDADVRRDTSLQEDYLHMLGANTGGFAHTTGPFEPGIRQILTETGSYYVLGYTPLHVDGKVHQVTVKTVRNDLQVVSRRAYQLDPPKPSNASPLIKALAGIVPDSSLPLKVNILPIAHPEAGARTLGQGLIVVTVAASAPAVTLRSVKQLELLVSVFDPEGRPKGQKRQNADVTLRPGGGDLQEFEVVTTYALQAGKYNVRVAAFNRTDAKSGSVYATVDVPDFARESLAMSGLFVQVRPGLVTAPAGALNGIFGFTPTTVRTFDATDSVDVALRVYRRSVRGAADVGLETSILDSKGRAVSSARENLPADCLDRTLPNPRDQFGCEYRFPVATRSLPPGDYLLQVVARASQALSTRREMRFTIR